VPAEGRKNEEKKEGQMDNQETSCFLGTPGGCGIVFKKKEGTRRKNLGNGGA